MSTSPFERWLDSDERSAAVAVERKLLEDSLRPKMSIGVDPVEWFDFGAELLTDLRRFPDLVAVVFLPILEESERRVIFTTCDFVIATIKLLGYNELRTPDSGFRVLGTNDSDIVNLFLCVRPCSQSCASRAACLVSWNRFPGHPFPLLLAFYPTPNVFLLHYALRRPLELPVTEEHPVFRSIRAQIEREGSGW